MSRLRSVVPPFLESLLLSARRRVPTWDTTGSNSVSELRHAPPTRANARCSTLMAHLEQLNLQLIRWL